MRSVKSVVIAALIAVIVAVCVPYVKAVEADDSNWPTKITFNEPVQVGELTLAPGTYEFRLTSGTVARNVIAIYSDDRNSWVGMVMGVNDRRVDTSKMTGFTLQDRGANAPKALEYWFYSGWSRGVKFIYPSAQSENKAIEVSAVR
jgi:hypothetical protein